MKLKGKQLIIQADGVAIAASKSCTIDVQADTIETSSPSQGSWRNYIAGRKKWNITTNHLVSADASASTPLRNMLSKVGKIYQLSFVVNGYPDDHASGSAICTACKITATLGNLMQGSFSWTGSGPLE